MKNQKGFSAVETLLVLILLAILGFTGYYVYHSQKSANKVLDTAQKTAVQTPAPDATADWTSYSSSGGQFSLKYPSTWVKAEGTGCIDDSTLLLGPTKDNAGRCASDATPEIFITSVASDKRPDYQYKTADYPDLKKETVTIDGVQGDKLSGTQNTGQDVFVGPPNGTKSVAYVFYTNGRTYAATYNQTPTAPDVMGQFNLIMTKTFHFHS